MFKPVSRTYCSCPKLFVFYLNDKRQKTKIRKYTSSSAGGTRGRYHGPLLTNNVRRESNFYRDSPKTYSACITFRKSCKNKLLKQLLVYTNWSTPSASLGVSSSHWGPAKGDINGRPLTNIVRKSNFDRDSPQNYSESIAFSDTLLKSMV